jgi:hypothetical protein
MCFSLTIKGFEYAEHSFFGDRITLTLSDGTPKTARDYPFEFRTDLYLTYGEINGLGGDFYGTSQPISDGSTQAEQRSRFMAAFKTLSDPPHALLGETSEILDALQVEVDAVNAALRKGDNPSIAYSKLPDEWKKFEKITFWRIFYKLELDYLRLARINFDHFGADARTVYNAGHAVAIEEAVKSTGNLDLAYALNAFADHFLEDSFSAGHLRTPRRDCHSLLNIFADFCAKVGVCSLYLSKCKIPGLTFHNFL